MREEHAKPMHLEPHPLLIAGIVMIVAATAVYLVAAMGAVLRVRRQYDGAIRGMGGLRTGSVLAALARLWPLVIVLVVGVVFVALGR